jgi:hypothetical protein
VARSVVTEDRAWKEASYITFQSSDAINADAGRRSPRKAGAAVTGSGRLRLPAQASRH